MAEKNESILASKLIINDNISKKIMSTKNSSEKPSFDKKALLKVLNSNNIYERNQIDRFNKFSRFGYFDPYNRSTITREYLFFTKMDLHLFEPGTDILNPEIANRPFFTEAKRTHLDTMKQLQLSVRNLTNNSPFVNLLSNTVISKLDLQDISIENLETGANIAGTRMEYPLATTGSNNLGDFNLEFEDTKHLDVYMFFRLWYEYELLKSNGLVSPPKDSYIINKILHDQMSCYKIIVGEDMETIIHWSKFWGVYPTSIPRSSFSDLTEDSIKLSVSFKYQWVEDMDPNILSDFNKIVSPKLKKSNKDIPIYDAHNEMVNGVWCDTPYITSGTLHNRRVYKLKWR